MERQGRSIIHLEIGEPDFDTPNPIVHAGIDVVEERRNALFAVTGVWDLRTAIARHLSSEHPTAVDPRNILVTPGAKMMIFSIIQSTVDPGDEVICPDPSYPAVRGGHPNGWAQRRFASSWKNPKTSGLTWISWPSDYAEDEINRDQFATESDRQRFDHRRLKKIADLARKHDLMIVSDEIYSEIYYGQRPRQHARRAEYSGSGDFSSTAFRKSMP